MVSGDGTTIKDICNPFLDWQLEKWKTGSIGPRLFTDCRIILTQFAKSMGKGQLVSDLRPEDFQWYRLTLARQLRPGINTPCLGSWATLSRGMSGIYVEEIELEHLRTVTESVRKKPFG